MIKQDHCTTDLTWGNISENFSLGLSFKCQIILQICAYASIKNFLTSDFWAFLFRSIFYSAKKLTDGEQPND